jgi:hypothetical protein
MRWAYPLLICAGVPSRSVIRYQHSSRCLGQPFFHRITTFCGQSVPGGIPHDEASWWFHAAPSTHPAVRSRSRLMRGHLMAASTSSANVLAWDNRRHGAQTESTHAIASLRFMADSFPMANSVRPKSLCLSVLRTNPDLIAIQRKSPLTKVRMSQERPAL